MNTITAIENFCEYLNKEHGDYYKWLLTKGRRYMRLCHKPKDSENGLSACAFIDITDGTVYYAASWKGRSNTVFGNVNENYYMDIVRRMSSNVYLG